MTQMAQMNTDDGAPSVENGGLRIVITTRSANEDLYAMASSFWPAHIARRRMTGFDHWRDALHYLHEILNTDADVVVNCDEDCFVHDWGQVEQLIGAMGRLGASYAGMPDTRDHHPGRNNGVFVHNPFFNVFHPRAVQQTLLDTPWYAHAVTVNSNPAGCADAEVFNNFFAALHGQLLGVDLRGRLHADGTSTVLSMNGGAPFALHAWYSRAYTTDAATRKRIHALYAEALSLKK